MYGLPPLRRTVLVSLCVVFLIKAAALAIGAPAPFQRSKTSGNIALKKTFNRIDYVPERAETIRVLLSNDGRNWSRAFPPGNTGADVGNIIGAILGQAPTATPPQKVLFGGADGKPLVVVRK